jgi:polyisoprenoid-binding protein YceI
MSTFATPQSSTGVTPNTTTWKLDPAHTLVEFSAKHMMISTVKGQFQKIDATVLWDEQNIANSSVEATIDAASLVTGQDMRDNHLRSQDFFHADEHPIITFKSTRIEPKSEDEFRVIGDLTIRGVTREVALDTKFEGLGKDPYGNEHAGFEATTKINRKDWDLNWNVALETGGWLVGDTIKVELHLELLKQNPA